MKKILDLLSEEMGGAFEAAGYDAQLGRVGLSNRPDLCEYQCNGAMAGARRYKKAPIMIAKEVADKLAESRIFKEVAAVAPGFLNLKISEECLLEIVKAMAQDAKFGLETPKEPKRIVIDYGGANIAKPLHVGHLRPAIIGESIKRICRYAGNECIGDIHMGDWGMPMGLVITELQARQPGLVYFDESYQGEYPEEAPFTIAELEEIYPFASARSKVDSEYKARAMEATYKLQSGVRGYRALWGHIRRVSVEDLKKNYDSLNVEFDLWKGESDVHDLIPEMVAYMKDGGYAYISEGALVVDVKEDTDTKEVPPCMILKSDGAALYNTTDLATIMERMRLYSPDMIIYITDKRQELYFEQVFRCARKTKLTDPGTELRFLGHGTMNGSDGTPFKTRDGGVLRLESLIQETRDEMYRKIREGREGREMSEEEAGTVSEIVAVAALKYGDLSNQAAKDYIFDIDRFTSSEGDTGPYILYTIVRIKSILNKYREQGQDLGRLAFLSGSGERPGAVTESIADAFLPAAGASEKALEMALVQFNAMLQSAAEEIAPHKVCAYIYDLANAFNRFYHETKILTEEDKARRESYIALLSLTKDVLETCIDLLGFSAPEKM